MQGVQEEAVMRGLVGAPALQKKRSTSTHNTDASRYSLETTGPGAAMPDLACLLRPHPATACQHHSPSVFPPLSLPFSLLLPQMRC